MAGSSQGSGSVGRTTDLRMRYREERILFFPLCVFFTRIFSLHPAPMTPKIRYLETVGDRDA